MKKILIYIYSMFLIIVLSCCNFNSNRKYQCYTDFPYRVNSTTQEEINLDSLFLRYPYRVEIEDSIAIILDLHPDNNYMYAFTYPGWQHIVSFGNRGEGPDDILSAERVRICSPDSVWVLDSNRRQITRWRIANGNAERVEEIPLDDRLIRTLDFCKTADGFLVTDYTGNYRYHVLDQLGKIIQSVDQYGKIKQSVGSIPTEKNISDENSMALAQAWRSFMDYNPKNGVLAIVTQLGEVVELFNLKTGEHHVCYGPGGEPVFSIAQSEAIPKGIKGFNDVVVSDSCIYTVFDGISFKDRIREFRSGKKQPEGGKYVYVFGFDGKQKERIELFNSAFGLSVLEGELLTTSTDADVPLYVYQ